jgi:hypothetical protein
MIEIPHEFSDGVSPASHFTIPARAETAREASISG